MGKQHLILEQFLPYRLSRVTNIVSDVIASAYKSLFALTIPEWRVIAVVAEHEGITQQAIGARTRMDKVTVSRAAVALAQRGLVERRPNPEDGRSRLLVLTASGRELYAAIAPKAMAMERDMFASFSAGELTQFNQLLDRIDAIAAAMLDKDRG